MSYNHLNCKWPRAFVAVLVYFFYFCGVVIYFVSYSCVYQGDSDSMSSALSLSPVNYLHEINDLTLLHPENKSGRLTRVAIYKHLYSN